MTIEKLLSNIETYNPDEIDIIRKSYEYADSMHSGQVRQSGEPYITHPLSVAYILSEMHADRDTMLQKEMTPNEVIDFVSEHCNFQKVRRFK